MSAPWSDWLANGRMFSTSDSDNDIEHGNCAVLHGCGWWFAWCSSSNVNKEPNGIWVVDAPVWDVQASRMLVKLNSNSQLMNLHEEH